MDGVIRENDHARTLRRAAPGDAHENPLSPALGRSRDHRSLIDTADSGKPLACLRSAAKEHDYINQPCPPAGGRSAPQSCALGAEPSADLPDPALVVERLRADEEEIRPMKSVHSASLGAPERDSMGDLSLLARGGIINLVGGAIYGLISFLVVTVVARGLTASAAGLFFEGVALFNISTGILVLGADVGLVKFISAHRAVGAGRGPRRTLAVALVPIASIAVAVAIAGWIATPRLAAALGNGAVDQHEITSYLRVFVVAIPISVVYTASIAATRGFGTMVPAVAVDKITKPSLQLSLVAAAVGAGLGMTALAVAWTLPVALGSVAAFAVLATLIRRLDRSERRHTIPQMTSQADSFWRFAAPRGLAGVFQVTVLWLDTILLGLLRSSREAAIYSASSRYLLVGVFVLTAVNQALAPQIGALLSASETKRAETVYQRAAWWIIAATWPIYLTLVIFAPVVLRVFGSEYEQGASVLVILGTAALVGAATGSVDWVLLMGGKSKWNLLNTAVALVANIALNLLLIPAYGMVGAAIAWAVSIMLMNILPMIEVRLLMGLSPFGRGFLLVVGASTACFGGLGLLARLVFGLSPSTLLIFLVVASAAYVTLIVRFRDVLQIGFLVDAVIRPRAGPRQTIDTPIDTPSG
jgi:O-antigen/teichoic acid export membrane protein